MHVPPWTAIPCIIVVAWATWADVRTRRIPNRLTAPAFLLGILVHYLLGGAPAAVNATLGGVVAGAILLPGWLMGMTGAGDVKLMAAVGAWIGYPGGLTAAIVALIAGGVLAVVAAGRKKMLGQALRNAFMLGFGIVARKAGGFVASPATTGVRFPFAPAILVGVLFALLRKG